MSISVPCTQNENFSNVTGAFNFIDSYVEYFSEIIMQVKNAIPEQGNRQHKEMQQHKVQQVICVNIISPKLFLPFFNASQKKYFYKKKNYSYQFSKEISPPPKLFS